MSTKSLPVGTTLIALKLYSGMLQNNGTRRRTEPTLSQQTAVVAFHTAGQPLEFRLLADIRKVHRARGLGAHRQHIDCKLMQTWLRS